MRSHPRYACDRNGGARLAVRVDDEALARGLPRLVHVHPSVTKSFRGHTQSSLLFGRRNELRSGRCAVDCADEAVLAVCANDTYTFIDHASTAFAEWPRRSSVRASTEFFRQGLCARTALESRIRATVSPRLIEGASEGCYTESVTPGVFDLFRHDVDGRALAVGVEVAATSTAWLAYVDARARLALYL